ncbi:hypothetical protein ACFL3S_06015 [Gemmatimonadota bacterium]
MSFWSRLFGTAAVPAKESGEKVYRERDNRGTLQDVQEKATAYWMARMPKIKKDPFVMYVFDREEDGRAALLELPCIHVAEDTKQLICTEVLDFGCYRREDGKYEAMVCGDDLTHELWEQARDSFVRHGGTRKNDLEPEKRETTEAAVSSGGASKVEFVREDRQQKMGKTFVYRIYKAPDAASAKAYLEQHPVVQQFHYVIVETPEGDYCRDIDGMYKE